jgi:hypothetical protein
MLSQGERQLLPTTHRLHVQVVDADASSHPTRLYL